MKTLDLIHTHLFPTVVAHCVYAELALKLLPYAQNFIEMQDNKNNGFNYKNTFNVTPPVSNLQKEFESFITDVALSYWKSVGIKEEINGIMTFFSEMNEGGRHIRHTHPGSKLAGVFYLNAPESSSEIRFFDPRPHNDFFHYTYTGQSSILQPNYKIKPYNGLFLIFPAWLAHETIINKTDNKRTTAVFNVW